MRFLAKLTVVALMGCAASAASGASAVTIFSDDFNAPGFVGASLNANDSSDRFGITDYFLVNDFNGWSFSSGAFLARPAGGADGALLLDESTGSASRLITGLTIGQQYSLSFLLSGDNRPGQDYVLGGSIAGLSFTVNGTVGASGSNTGTLVGQLFTATNTQHMLSLEEQSLTQGSPIIDNLTITFPGYVPEPTNWAMMLAGFGLVGFAARRRRAIAA
jgi:hypothetical protein